MARSTSEVRRIEVLRSYGVLDTEREPAFDDIAELAAALCEAPIGLISLIDEDRLWFKAVHGADWHSTDRDIAFCAHAIEQQGLFIVEDAVTDPRFAANPLVCGELGLRFYAGMPLVDAQGVSLGTLAVVDHVPRRLRAVQQRALEVLAGQVVAQFQGRRRQRQLEEALLERERGHAALRESEGRWRLLFERNPMPMWIFDTHTLRFLAVNDAAVLQYGWSPSEFLSMTLRDIRPPEDVPALMDDLAEGHDTLHSGREWRHRTKSGRLIHVDIVAHSINFDGRAARLVLAQDVSERLQAVQALRHSEERFRLVSRATADAIWDWDVLAGGVWWNEGIETLFGHAHAALEPGAESWTTRIHPDDLQRVKGSIDAVIAGAEDRWSSAYRFARVDGSWADVQDRGFVIRDRHGVALRMVGGMSDLSVQRQAERQLRQQAALLDAARDAIVVRDLDDHITYWNRGAEQLFGWSADEAVGHDASELLSEDEVVMAHAREAVLSRGEWQAVVQCRGRDGRPLRVDMRLTLLRDAAGAAEAVLAIKTDVTQRMALEAQLQQALRLEAVGQLTGGVAHDFNNLLTAIQGNAELMADVLAQQPAEQPVDRAALAQMVAMVGTAAQRGAELTQRLLAFARKQPLQPQAVDTHQVLAGMDALLRRTLPADIELQLLRAPDLWPMVADPVQIESALLNLVLNARDAMPGGGKLTLQTANAWIDQADAERHIDLLPGPYVLISVSDTGVGMGPAELARAFEPFFTTKGAGRGSGLGLSMVYGFAKQSRGHVSLSSQPGQGTTARLYLPRFEGASPPRAGTALRADGDLRGSAIVLVAEDDDLVRRFATDLLRGLGYQVLAAENGVAALAVLRARDDVELLFTDVVMPGGLNGRQLADAALELHPQLKVLFTSGYTENAIVHHGRLERGVHLLAKPYRAVDLARKLRALLD